MNVPLLGQKYILIWTELEGHFDYFPSSLRVTNIAYDNKLIIEIPIVKKSGRPDIVTLFQVPVREQKFVCMYVRMYVCMYVCTYFRYNTGTTFTSEVSLSVPLHFAGPDRVPVKISPGFRVFV